MNQFLAQIQPFAFNFAPQGWMPCNGQLLPVTQNTALYSLLGVRYGGDGNNTFGLPNLAPIGPNGPNYFIAVTGVYPPLGS